MVGRTVERLGAAEARPGDWSLCIARRQDGGYGMIRVQQQTSQPVHILDGYRLIGAGDVVRGLGAFKRQRVRPACGQAADAVVAKGQLREFVLA